jgi:hypothetical protein
MSPIPEPPMERQLRSSMSPSPRNPPENDYLEHEGAMLDYHGNAYQTTSWTRCPELDIFKIASPSFVGQTDLCFDTDSHTTYSFLRSFPEPALKSIKKLHLTSMTTVEYWADLDHYARKLGRFIVRDMSLESITLAIPGDQNANSNMDTDVRKDGAEIEEYPFTWTLHEAVINAFRRGQFTEVKFAHSELYPDTINVFGFRDVQTRIKKMLWTVICSQLLQV